MSTNDEKENICFAHDMKSDAKGRVYCRCMNTVTTEAFFYCKDCPLCGDQAAKERDNRGVCCVYADEEFSSDKMGPEDYYERICKRIREGVDKEFPDYLPKNDPKSLRQKAIQYAAEAHKGTVRKGNKLPYIIHPIEVMALVSQMTNDEEVIAAAALHDVVEDTPRTIEDIRGCFGERIAKLVDMESENKRPDLPKEQTWRIRKEESLSHDREMPPEAKYIMLADKLSNMRATQRDFAKDGHNVWQKFNMKDEKQQEWYYRKVAEVLSDLSEEALYKEYAAILDEIFG